MKKVKYLLALSVMALAIQFAIGQTQESKISENDWNTLIPLLTQEKWPEAEKMTLKYMKRYSENEDSLAETAILRYMYLRCVATRLSNKDYSKNEALKKTKMCIGKPIITPPKTFFKKCMFNCFHVTEDGKNFFSCSSNTSMTEIHIFETYNMMDTSILSNSDSLIGKGLRIGAFVKQIEAGGEMMPRLDILFDQAFIWEEYENVEEKPE